MELEDQQEVDSTQEWARKDMERRRLAAYAHPETGSDRFFAEAQRLEAQGLPEEATEARVAGVVRYSEIKAMYPWPDA